MKKLLALIFIISNTLAIAKNFPLETFDNINSNSLSPNPNSQLSLPTENGVWIFDYGPTNPLLWKIKTVARDDGKCLAFKWNCKNKTWLTASLSFSNPMEYNDKNAVAFSVLTKKPIGLDFSINVTEFPDSQTTFSSTIENINSKGKWTNIIVNFCDMYVPEWYKNENPNKKLLKNIPTEGYIYSISVSPVWNSSGECEIDDIFLIKRDKVKKRNPNVIDDFSDYAPKKIKAGFSFPKEYSGNNNKWIFAAGPKDPLKWNITFAEKRRKNKIYKFLVYDWNNKSSTWLSASCYFKRPALPPACNALAFSAQANDNQKADVTLVLANKEETPFQTSVKIKGKKKGWENIIVPFKKLSIPKWFSGTNTVNFSEFPTNYPILAVSISPGWNSVGKLAIDNIIWTNVSIASVKSLKFKNKQRASSLNKIKSYACYYGAGKINEMSHFDAVIFEPKNFSKKEIAKLKRAGTITIGYVTIGEDDDFHKDADWYFDRNKDGKPDKNGTWNSFYADARSKKWRDFVVNEKAKEVIINKGCDGIFLDTVDTAQLYSESEDGMIKLIKELREKYPKAIIVQNRGFSVIEKTAKYVDGLMYEDFSTHINFDPEEYSKMSDADLNWSKQMAENTLAPIMKETGLTVLALDYAKPEQKDLIRFAYSRAKYYNFVPYVATIALDEIFVRKVKDYAYKPPEKQKATVAKNPVNGNLCRKNKIKTFVDSSFLGYSSKTLTDGYRQEKNLEWYERSWASAEYPGEHFVKIIFPEKQTIKKIIIYWAIEGKEVMASQLVKVFADSEKNLIAETRPEKSLAGEIKTISEINLKKPIIAKKLIFLQPQGKGPAMRPDIMWINEIEVY